MPTFPNPLNQGSKTESPAPNVVQRLAQAIGTAKEMGFEVRKIVLDGQVAGWCQIGTKKILFLDLTATASEQLEQIDEIVASYCNRQNDRESGRIAA